MTTALTTTTPPTVAAIAPQAGSDAQMIALWLHGKSAHSQRAYSGDVAHFFSFVGKPLQSVILADLQAWSDSLDGAQNSKRRIVSSVKSLFTFAHKLGYVHFNVGAALKSPKAKDELAARILTEEQVMAMITKTDKPRDKVLIRLLYASAGRISEVSALSWRDVQPNGETGQVTLFGKNGDTRAVKLSKSTWQALLSLRGDAGNNAPVFVSQKGGRLDETQVHRVVRSAAQRAGIEGNVSAHWLRHSHASHALDRGASIALVRDTLGHKNLAVTSRYTHAKPNDSSALHLAV